MTSEAAALSIFAALLIIAGLLLLLYVIEGAPRPHQGYRSGSKPVSEYRQPPKGPAAGGKRG